MTKNTPRAPGSRGEHTERTTKKKRDQRTRRTQPQIPLTPLQRRHARRLNLRKTQVNTDRPPRDDAAATVYRIDGRVSS